MLFCFNAGEIFQVAINIEANGIAFYEKAQTLITDPEVKQLFSVLAQEEREHKKHFEAFKAELPKELTSPTVKDTDNELEAYIADMAKNHVFSDLKDLNTRLSEAKTVSDAIQLALQCEKDSVIFYLSMLEATCEGKARDFVDLLIKEEQSHVKRLSIQLRKCSADARECLLNWPA